MKRIALLFVSMAAATFGYAQGCSVCTQTAAGLGKNSAEGLNAGILYLAALPLIFMITVGVIWWKRSKGANA